MKKLILIVLFLNLTTVHLLAQTSWQVLSTNTTKSLSGVQCYAKDTLLLYGEDGIILYSDDGGSHFTLRSHPTSGFTTGYFKSIDTGFVSSGSGSLFRTINGGSNWSSATSCGCLITSIGFANPQVGIFGGLTGVFKTTDGGASWATTPLISSASPGRIVSLNTFNFMFVDGNRFYKSMNTGNTFTIDTLNYGSSYPLVGLNFINDSVGFMSSADGKLLKTSNQGASWNLVGSIGWPVRDLVFTDELNGYAIINSLSNTISRTADGGLNWVQDYVGTTLIEQFDFDGKAVYAVGQNGLAIKKEVYPTGAKNQSKNSPFQFYPNPANDKLFLSGITGKIKLQVFQTDGRLLSEEEMNGNYTLDISSLPAGIYFVKIQDASTSSGIRFIKE